VSERKRSRLVNRFLIGCLQGIYGNTWADWKRNADAMLRLHLTDEQWERLMELLELMFKYLPILVTLI